MAPRYMSSALHVTRPPLERSRRVADSAPAPRLFTTDDYHVMGQAGILTENDRCELVNGIIRKKPEIRPRHKNAVRRLVKLLTPLIDERFVLDSQAPVSLATDSEPKPDVSISLGPEERYNEPEPDLVVARGTREQYKARHPNPEELELIVEGAESSLRDDRTTKLELYAENGIPCYWIVNLKDRRVEVHTQPRLGKKPGYRKIATYSPRDSVPVVVKGKKVSAIPVDDILP